MERLRKRLDGLLTTGQFTYSQLKKMFITLTLDQFFICFISLLSTALVSSVGEAAIAAVSMVGTVNSLASLVFMSLATGGAIVVSRAKGRGDEQEIRRVIGEAVGLCCTVSLGLSAALFLSADALVRAIYPHVEPLLIEYAVKYMRMMAISFIPFSVFNVIFNIFRSLGDTRSSLFLTVVINLSHLLLSLLFINGLSMGVAGSGMSYIVARTLGMLLAVFWLIRHTPYHIRLKLFFRFTPAVTKEIMSLGMPLTVEALLTQGGMLLVQVYLARLTTTDLAAHAVSNSMLNLYCTSANALTALASTVCGQCYGAKRYDLTRQYCRNLVKVGRFVLLITVLLLYPLTPLLLRLYHATEQGTAIIYTCLRIAVFLMPLLWCDGNIPSMVLRTAGDSVYSGAVSVSALLLGRCILGYTLTIVLGLGVPGVWIALVCEWAYRSVALRLRFRGDQWLHIRAA
ncbi:MAG: MATE family efflux transporter [Clostridia bacterium]|nr:MATE family efflux transporter [Clostridia bacterium]